MAPHDTAPPLVRAADLTIGYGGAPVCAPITAELRPGQVLAVVGANGTGKSTFLRTVTALLEPMGGTVRVLGVPPDPRAQPYRLAVSTDLGEDVFFPALTTREHVLLTAYGHGVADAPALSDELLREFGLDAHAHVLPVALSSGQRRRLQLASALARPRDLLILDEPEQRLDVGMRSRLADRLRQERESGGAVLMACHDPSVVLRAATAVLILTEDSPDVVGPQAGAEAIENL